MEVVSQLIKFKAFVGKFKFSAIQVSCKISTASKQRYAIALSLLLAY